MNLSEKFKAFTRKRATAEQVVQPFSMSRTDDNSAEIVLYGDIVSERPKNWWTNEPIEGQYIILNEFLEELDRVKDVKDLIIRIHSTGGNAYDAMVIHNKLKSLDAKVTVIVDGVAMSGGSLIMCAGDVVQVYPGSLIMIHKCWTQACGNSDELRRVADCNDAVDRSQAAIYHVKTGMDVDTILEMMQAETYMTGEEAVKMGFADEILDGAGMEIAASADRRTLFVGTTPVWTSHTEHGIPTALNIPTVKSVATATVTTNKFQQPGVSGNPEGGNKPMANTIEELRAEYPELSAQMEANAQAAASASAAAEAVRAEQQRLQEIDAVSALFDAELVQAAKYGENACSAQELTYRAAKKAAQTGSNFLSALYADAQMSGTQNIGAAPSGDHAPEIGEMTPEQKLARARNEVSTLFGKHKEG